MPSFSYTDPPPRAPKGPWLPDSPRQGLQFDVYTSGGIICIGGGWFLDPVYGGIIEVEGAWTGADIRTDGWAMAVVTSHITGEASGITIGFIAGSGYVPPEPDDGSYVFPLARIKSRNILPILAGRPLVFAPPPRT